MQLKCSLNVLCIIIYNYACMDVIYTPHLELMHTCAVTARMKALSHAIVAYFKYIYNKNEVHNSYIKLEFVVQK